MLLGISVEPRCIAVKHHAHIRRQIIIFAVHRPAHIKQGCYKVDRCALGTIERCHPAPRHRGHFLQRRKIVLGMRIGHAISDIGVGLAENMRNTKFVADDPGLIGTVGWRCSSFDAQRFPDCQPDSRQHKKCQQPEARPFKCFHVFYPSGQRLKLRIFSRLPYISVGKSHQYGCVARLQHHIYDKRPRLNRMNQ